MKHITGPLWWESTGNWYISFIKGQIFYYIFVASLQKLLKNDKVTGNMGCLDAMWRRCIVLSYVKNYSQKTLMTLIINTIPKEHTSYNTPWTLLYVDE